LRNEVYVDSKGRISLAWRVHSEHKLYLAEESEQGVIILTPGALVPAVVRVPEDPTSPIEDAWQDFFPYGKAMER